LDITITFFLSLLIAFLGVIPPGLLNMTAAKISLKEGHVNGLIFSIGVCVIVGVQTIIALIFSRYLSKNPEVISLLQRVAFVIFVLIAIYFLVIAKKKSNKPKKEREPRSKNSRFFFGMLLSVLNVFPIPYQAYMSITVAALGFLEFDNIGMLSYTFGAIMGTFVTLYIYVFFFEKINSQYIKSSRNMSRLIGIVTGVIALITLINIIRDL
jgi:threonine/homoserine/homoserine lactone efflux protein